MNLFSQQSNKLFCQTKAVKGPGFLNTNAGIMKFFVQKGRNRTPKPAG
jgi:hypothetical protein